MESRRLEREEEQKAHKKKHVPEENDDEPKQKEEPRWQRHKTGQTNEDEWKCKEEAERHHQKRQKEQEDERMQKEAQEDAGRQQKKRREEDRQTVDWKRQAEELARDRFGRSAPPRQGDRLTIARKPPPSEGFQPVAATVTTKDYLHQKNFTGGPLDVDGDGWYPLHHAIQDTMAQAGLLDVVLELARATPVKAFDRLANNPRASG